MRVTRLWTAGTCAALVICGLGVPASAVRVPVLAGTTTFTAARAAYLDVRVPRPATVATPLTDSPDLTVLGAGRMAGFALVGTGGAAKDYRLVGGADSGGTRFLMPAKGTSLDVGSYGRMKTYRDIADVPAGDYRLYVVPDGGAVTFTLRLHGLPGRVDLRPARRAGAEIANADGGGFASPASFTGTVTRGLDGPGLVVHLIRARIDASIAWQVLFCHGRHDKATAPPLPLPGCPTGDSHTASEHRHPDVVPQTRLFVQTFASLQPGSHTVGGTFSAVGSLPTAPEYLTLWIAF